MDNVLKDINPVLQIHIKWLLGQYFDKMIIMK